MCLGSCQFCWLICCAKATVVGPSFSWQEYRPQRNDLGSTFYILNVSQYSVFRIELPKEPNPEVRIAHAVTTGFEEEDFLSPAGQRRKTLRSMTTSNISISPRRSFASPPSTSPERERSDRGDRGGNKLSRRSDPTLLSSNRSSPRIKTSKTTQLERIK